MHSIDLLSDSPLPILDLPPIDSVRPAFCPHCGVVAGPVGGRNIIGHGRRWRAVIGRSATVVTTWVWRFYCRRCRRTCSVRPEGLADRLRYALAAIVVAWVHAAPLPVGDGLDDEAVYALVGVDRRTAATEFRSGKQRWRSLARWAARLDTWWPTRPTVGATWRQRVTALVTGFLPGEGGRDGAIRRALAAHTAGGRPM